MWGNPWEFCPDFSLELSHSTRNSCGSNALLLICGTSPSSGEIHASQQISDHSQQAAKHPHGPNTGKGRQWCPRAQTQGDAHLCRGKISLPALTSLTGDFVWVSNFPMPAGAVFMITIICTSSQPQLGSSQSLFPKEAVTDNKHQSNPTSNLIVFSKYH